MQLKTSLRYLEDRWDDQLAGGLDQPELLRYRSNLLGSDLRITNFGGGNTSSKIQQTDPLSGKQEEVLWIKGSGGDLGSIKLTGLAALYSEKLHGLEHKYRGAEFEDEMVEMYPLCAFGKSTVAASIDTPLHGFLPFPHIDHLHPDWGIALAASANGREKMEEFNRLYDHHLIWVPWQRPGFELAMMLRRAVQASPNCDGVVLGGHGLFTWGSTQQECYENTISIIDQLGQFVLDHVAKKGAGLFGGPRYQPLDNRRDLALDIFPFLRGRVSGARRLIGNFSDLPEVLRFVNSADAERLAHLGTSCPDHFLRTKISPLVLDISVTEDLQDVKKIREKLAPQFESYRQMYAHYYDTCKHANSPAMRDPNPVVILYPGIGMFTFSKDKQTARVAAEFYINAINVMKGAEAVSSYTSLPRQEAFNIEYWLLEEAKLQRMPKPKALSGRIALVTGSAGGIGKAIAKKFADEGALLVRYQIAVAFLQPAQSGLKVIEVVQDRRGSVVQRKL